MLAINENKKGLFFDFDFNINSIVDILKDKYYKIKVIKELNEVIYSLETIKEILEIEDITSFKKENLEDLLKKEILLITTLEKFLKRDIVNGNSLLKTKLNKIYKLSKILYNLTLEKLEDIEDLEDIIKSRSEDKKSVPLKEFLEMDL